MAVSNTSTPDTQQTPAPALPRRAARLSAVIARLCVGAGVGAGLPLMAIGQEADIEEILVVDRQRAPYRIDQSSLTKFTEPLRDTPQTVTTLSEELLEDRAAMSLNDALRNVPGITLGAGEFSWQGNNPNIRGFSARNDMFLDGMRDFGSYPRDPFNLEAVEVLQGPSSMVFGRGSTGGVINQSSKRPVADPLRSLHVNVGNADTRRATTDINQPLDGLNAGPVDNLALRLNAMVHEAGVPGRDVVEAERYGIAPSLSMDLGSATHLTLSFMKQHGEHIPDYGLPWVDGEPADVERDTYYGFESDFLDTDAEITTLELEHALNEDLSAEVKLRYADYDRSSRITEPLVDPSVTRQTPPQTVEVERNVFRGESRERMFQGQFNLNARFSTGAVDHALVAGIELAEETSSPSFGFGEGVPSTTLLNPVREPFSADSVEPRLKADTEGDSLAAYVLDTVKFNERWQWVAGIRWDRFETDYAADRFEVDGSFVGREEIARTDIETSYRTALVYKPVPEGTVYLAWGTSFNPSSEDLSFINSGRNLTTSNAYLEPESNRSLELGGKWELLDGGLFLEGAVFRIVKSNARVPDPANPGFNLLAGEQQVDGFSLNATGQLGRRLSVSGGYTYLDSSQEESTQTTVEPGSPLQNVAENNFSLWLNYAATDRFEFGFGARYLDERLATNAAPVKSVPDYWVADAMAKYQATDTLTFKLNLTNLTDETYYDQLHPWHVIPGPGFASVFAVNWDY